MWLANGSGDEPLTEISEDGQMCFLATETGEVVFPRKMILTLDQLIAFGLDLAIKLSLQPFMNSAISCPINGLKYVKKCYKE